jgi:HEPN domain-containing protein
MTNQSLVSEWLKRAHSNLERAGAGKTSDGVLYEDLCYDCQQAVEKSLKAFLIHLNIEFEWVHSVAARLKQIENAGVTVPESIKDASILSEYAVDTRYPGWRLRSGSGNRIPVRTRHR